ncbi:MAG: hypothetical protein IJC11_07220 [Alphaproteobacteria bacterium]|nr:hypothetical protein [Alphaproteobacteria bacterium]MBQ3118089.1 hypothetical protein [Alphaproteobacteria bacterium]MBQ6855271.1 hypothetical protein [Alphaproteobacteria bacterium]MBQ8557963.1 hypothetical protein [Alphaproteobacteria bacterium]MBR3913383.1 hypothetical protein [Alphaproteobacteria bacterium]
MSEINNTPNYLEHIRQNNYTLTKVGKCTVYRLSKKFEKESLLKNKNICVVPSLEKLEVFLDRDDKKGLIVSSYLATLPLLEAYLSKARVSHDIFYTTYYDKK